MRNPSEDTHLISGTFDDGAHAEKAVQALLDAGYGPDEITREDSEAIAVRVRPHVGDETRVRGILQSIPTSTGSFDPSVELAGNE